MAISSRPYQEGFSVGELDPKMVARIGVEAYYAGARHLTNLMHLPTGAVTRRFGTKYVGTVIPPAFNVRMEPFEFSEAETYLTLWSQTFLQIYRASGNWPVGGPGEDQILQTIAGVSSIPYNDAEIPLLRTTQSADTMIITHENHAPRRLVRDTTVQPEVFRIYDLSDPGPDLQNPLPILSDIPLFNFDDDLSPSPTTAIAQQEIIFLGTWIERVGFKFSLQGTEHDVAIFWFNDMEFMRGSIEAELRTLYNLPDPAGLTVAFDPDPPPDDRRFVVTFGGGNAGIDWDEMIYRISANQGSSEDGVIDINEVTPGASRAEPVWSDVRGWPRTCTFHEDRLIFGGSKSRPATLWGSRSGDYFSFDVGDALDADAIDVTLQTDRLDAVRACVSSRHLQLFSVGGEFYTPEVPITPTNIAFSRQTEVGTSLAPPVQLDGTTLFVDREGRGLRQFLFAFTEDAYKQQDISIMSQHLIRDPVGLAVLQTVEGDYIFVVNTDGTIACLNLIRDQQVSAWSEFTTEGKFEAVTAVGRAAYALVQRGTRRYLERMSRDYMTDAGLKQSAGSTEVWTGFGHLEGMTADVVADGYPWPQQTVAGGIVNTPGGASSIEAGLPFRALIESMPVTVATAEGQTQTRSRRVSKVDLMLNNCGALIVNGWPLSQRRGRAGRLANPAPPLTGQFEVRLRGWSRSPTVVITQNQPLPFEVLAIGYKLEIGA